MSNVAKKLRAEHRELLPRVDELRCWLIALTKLIVQSFAQVSSACTNFSRSI